jgi:hypothetical protein
MISAHTSQISLLPKQIAIPGLKESFRSSAMILAQSSQISL